MKILKNSTYNDLIKNNDSLKIEVINKIGENFELEHEVEKLLKYKTEFYNSKLNFSIKRVIVGKRGSGKTHFILNKILPRLKNHLIIDFLHEYEYHSQYNIYEIPTDKDSTNKLRKKLLKAIDNNRDKIIILDNSNLVGFKWFQSEMMIRFPDVSYISVCVNKTELDTVRYDLDCIYDFGANDEFRYRNDEKPYILDMKNYNKR